MSRPWFTVAVRFALTASLLLPADFAVAHAAFRAAASAPLAATALAGRPKVKLVELRFPPELPEARHLERHLRKTLAREARQADWGADARNKIEYRFIIDHLSLTEEGDVIRVRCRATGQLPKGKRASTDISFGGDKNNRQALLKKVLDIVAQGVVVRLAELERARRGGD